MINSKPRWQQPNEKVLGVIMIVKNEAENLPELFSQIVDLADEVVVVDTGSTDATREICTEWGVKLVERPWKHDFSYARNEAIKQSTTRFMLWLDGDDRLPEETVAGLTALRDTGMKNHKMAYQFEVISKEQRGTRTFLQPRLIPNLPGIEFVKPIHEQIFPALQKLKIKVVLSDFQIVHLGYASPEVVLQKAKRNEDLLKKAIEKGGADLHLLMHLAQTVALMQRYKEAEHILTKAFELKQTNDPQLLAELYIGRAQFRSRQGNRPGAKLDIKTAEEILPAWGVSKVYYAEILMSEQDWEGVLEACDAARDGAFYPGITALPVARLRTNVEIFSARALSHLNRNEEALDRYLKALAMDDSLLDIHLEAGHHLLVMERFEKAKTHLERVKQEQITQAKVFVEHAAGLSLARAMTGDEDGAIECLIPLLEIFADDLEAPTNTTAMELAQAAIQAQIPLAARHLLTLHQKTLPQS